MYGKDDIRLEEFELPAIWEDEILVRVVTDSLCISTFKALKQGSSHKRVPADIGENPVILGHEFAGDIVTVGEKWKGRYRSGERFAIQPNLKTAGILRSPGYSYRFYGGASTYCIIPNEAIESDCLVPYLGKGYFAASLAEPISCVIAGFRSNYHRDGQSYRHIGGVKKDGNMLIIGGCGPMGLGAVSYALVMENRPARVVVTGTHRDKISRAAVLFESEAVKKGIELHFVNTRDTAEPEAGLKAITKGRGFDDVFLYVADSVAAELANCLLAPDGCMNIFAGPANPEFKASVNLAAVHYLGNHIVGVSGGLAEDVVEAVRLIETRAIRPEAMITHIGGLNCYKKALLNLYEMSGHKKLIYTQIEMPLTAIADFGHIGKNNSLFRDLADCCDSHQGLWNSEAEKILLDHYAV